MAGPEGRIPQAQPRVVLFAVLFTVPRTQWAPARHFILTLTIPPVNILADREIVPEFIPFHASRIIPVARECPTLLSNPALRQTMSQELRAVTAPLVARENNLAFDRVADEIERLIPALGGL